MIVTERRYDNEKTVADNVDNDTAALDEIDAVRDENGMTRDDRFDQLEDESRVVTSGRGSSLASGGTTTETNTTGYSAGVGSGTPE